VLLRSGEVLDCATGLRQHIVKGAAGEAQPAEHNLEVYARDGMEFLIEARDGEMMQYSWKNSTGTWELDWDFGSAGKGLRGLGTLGNRLLLFHGAPSGHPAITVHDVATMEKISSWLLPKDVSPLRGGCVWADGKSALVLPQPGAAPGSSVPSVVKVQLRATGTFDSQANDAAATPRTAL